jgi:hypothetical protein
LHSRKISCLSSEKGPCLCTEENSNIVSSAHQTWPTIACIWDCQARGVSVAHWTVQCIAVTIQALRIGEIVTAIVRVRLEPAALIVGIFSVLSVLSDAGSTIPEPCESIVGIVATTITIYVAITECSEPV